jgi:predicted PurR-regulated permease PerM
MASEKPFPQNSYRPLLVGEVVRTACLFILALCVTGAALAMLKHLVTPLLVAVFLFYLIKPAVDGLSRRRAPAWVIVSIFAVISFLVVMVMVRIVYSNVYAFQARIPEYREKAIFMVESYYRMTGLPRPGDKKSEEDEQPEIEGPKVESGVEVPSEVLKIESRPPNLEIQTPPVEDVKPAAPPPEDAKTNVQPRPPVVPSDEPPAEPDEAASESPSPASDQRDGEEETLAADSEAAGDASDPTRPEDEPPSLEAAEEASTSEAAAGEVDPSAETAIPHEAPRATLDPMHNVPKEKQVTLTDLIDIPWQQAVEYAFGTALGFLEGSLMTLFYLVFLFLEAEKLPRRVQRGFPQDDADHYRQVGRSINASIERYVALKTYINFGLSATTGILCMLFGLDFWFLWAVVMFLANYITYIGSVVALAPPIVLAFLQFTPLTAIVLSLLLVANRLIWIDYIEIRVFGKQLNVSPVILLFSIALFGFLWGTAGMVLAVPLVTSAKIVLSHFENTRRYAVLMSED